jgi:hypothetical protein
MKRVILLLVLAVIVAGGISAQGTNSGAKNWISGELSLFGIGARYERMFGANFSAGVDAYWNSLFILWNELELGLFGRFYPWEDSFFVEAGLGYHTHTSFSLDDDSEVITGLAISPGVGWRIDVGNPGGFFISPGIKFPITFGINNITDEFEPGVGFVAYIGLGGAF